MTNPAPPHSNSFFSPEASLSAGYEGSSSIDNCPTKPVFSPIWDEDCSKVSWGDISSLIPTYYVQRVLMNSVPAAFNSSNNDWWWQSPTIIERPHVRLGNSGFENSRFVSSSWHACRILHEGGDVSRRDDGRNSRMATNSNKRME